MFLKILVEITSICHYGAELLGSYYLNLTLRSQSIFIHSFHFIPHSHGHHALLEDNHSILQPFIIPNSPTVLVDIVSSPIIVIMALDFSGIGANPSVLEAIS